MGPFPFWNYGDEKAAAGDLAREHKKHLQACGVRMGRGGFGVLDLHDEDDLLELPVGESAHRNDNQRVLSKAEWPVHSLWVD